MGDCMFKKNTFRLRFQAIQRIALVLAAYFLFTLGVAAQDSVGRKNFSIEYFAPRDLSTDVYSISIRTNRPNELMEELKGKNGAKYVVMIGEVSCVIKKDSIQTDDNNPSEVDFDIEAYYALPMGQTTIQLLKIVDEDESIIVVSSDKFSVPDRKSSPGMQPLITGISPEAGRGGDTITITGQNFGDDIDKIQIIFNPRYSDPDAQRELIRRKPFYISTITGEKDQQIKFNVPRKSLLKSAFYKRELYVQIVVAGRPSDFGKFVVLTDHWKIWIMIFTLIVILVLYFLLAYVMRRFNFVDSLLIDKDTNTYSLSKFQAILWTVILLGSYFYIAISYGLLLGNGKIPDFNPSLIGLLAISYGGMIGATGLGSTKPKNEIVRNSPQFSNLFSSGGSIDIARLQLFGFTIVGAIIYLYNLVNANPLDGLPDIPTTLLGLMGVSHSGYLGGKVIGDKTSINIVKPYYIPAHLEEGCKIHILGAGFEKNTKLLLDEIGEPMETDFVSGSALGVKIPKLGNQGPKKITLLPPGRPPISADDCFEAVIFEEYKFPAKIPFTIIMYSHSIPTGLKLSASGEMDDYYEGIMEFKGDCFELTFPGMLPGNKHITMYADDKDIEINLDRAILIQDELLLAEDEKIPEETEEEVTETEEETESEEPVSFDTGSSSMHQKSFYLEDSGDKNKVSAIEFIINP